MGEDESKHTVIRFVNEINRHDLVALASLMAADFRFIDSEGREIRGRERVCEAWTTYFASHPDFRLAIREHMAIGQFVALFGTASGSDTSTAGARSAVPTAWRAVVSAGQVTEWQVYGGRGNGSPEHPGPTGSPVVAPRN